jgi:hypothetical protein
VADPSFLRAFSHCTNAYFFCVEAVDIELLTSALSKCTALSALFLMHRRLTAAHLSELLPRMPQLTSLSIYHSAAVTSLAFAHSLPRLRTLCVHGSAHIPPVELHRLRDLPALTELELSDCFTPPLDALTIAAFMPGSAEFLIERLPALKSFQHQ